MNVNELHYQFKLNVDRVDSLSKPDFNRAEIDFFLNEAQLVFVKQRMSALSNPKGKGFESTQKRIDDLSTLVIKYPTQGPIVPTPHGALTYEVPFSSLAFPYYALISAKVKGHTAPDCLKTIQLKYVQHDDITEIYRDPFNSPSDEFIPYTIGRSSASSSSSIYFYTPVGFTPDEVYIEYVKYPSRISIGNYTYFDGVTYPAATSELPPHTHNEIVDIASQLAAMSMEDQAIQVKTAKVQIHE
jgi:hypothetical protein